MSCNCFLISVISLIFGAWAYQTTKMNITNMDDTLNVDGFEENGEWEIYKTSAVRHVRQYTQGSSLCILSQFVLHYSFHKLAN